MIQLLIIGDEILSGRRQDKHLAKAIELAQARGMRVGAAHYVGDEPDPITEALQRARAGGEVVFSFGGIGATPDDHTRGCAGRAWEAPLVLHEEAKALILDRCRDVAAEQGVPFDPHSPDNVRRLDMGHFPVGARIIPNPFNRIPGFSMDGRVHFLPGFPVMAWPMMAWVLDHWHADLHGQDVQRERSLIVHRAIESTLTPLMVEIEAVFEGVKVFSLPSVDHPVHGRHIELGVKGAPDRVDAAFEAMVQGLRQLGAEMGPESVRSMGGS